MIIICRHVHFLFHFHSGYSGRITDERVQKFMEELKEKEEAKLAEAWNTEVNLGWLSLQGWIWTYFLCPIITPTASECYAINLQIADLWLCRTPKWLPSAVSKEFYKIRGLQSISWSHNIQMLLDDVNRITIPHGNFQVFNSNNQCKCIWLTFVFLSSILWQKYFICAFWYLFFSGMPTLL